MDCRRSFRTEDFRESSVSREIAKLALAVGFRGTWNLDCDDMGGWALGIGRTFGGGVGGVGGIWPGSGYIRDGSLCRTPSVSGECM